MREVMSYFEADRKDEHANRESEWEETTFKLPCSVIIKDPSGGIR